MKKPSNPSILRGVIVAAALISAGNAQAIHITDVTAMTDIGTALGSISQVVDGSELWSVSLTATHNAVTPSSFWLNPDIADSLDFSSSRLIGLAVWNFDLYDTVEVKNLTIEENSTDAMNYSPLVGAPLLFAIGVSLTPELEFDFSPVTMSYLRSLYMRKKLRRVAKTGEAAQ